MSGKNTILNIIIIASGNALKLHGLQDVVQRIKLNIMCNFYKIRALSFFFFLVFLNIQMYKIIKIGTDNCTRELLIYFFPGFNN